MTEPSFNVEDFMNYESPIKLIADEISTSVSNQTENHIMSAVQHIGIDVNKEELVKALNYDRDSYTKGYNDAYHKGFSEGIKSRESEWIPIRLGMTRCPNCGNFGFETDNYCSFCGMRMINAKPLYEGEAK